MGKTNEVTILGILKIEDSMVIIHNFLGITHGATMKKVGGKWFKSNIPISDLAISIAEAAFWKGNIEPVSDHNFGNCSPSE